MDLQVTPWGTALVKLLRLAWAVCQQLGSVLSANDTELPGILMRVV